MAIPKQILSYLEKNKIKYEAIEHRPVFTAWDLVQTLHLKKPEEAVKTLIFNIDNEHVLILLPPNKNFDKAKFKNLMNGLRKKQGLKGVKKMDFVKEAWMKKNIKIGKLGAVPPFGKLLGLPVFADNIVLKQKKVLVSGGDHNISLKISIKDFIKSEEPIKGSFSQKK